MGFSRPINCALEIQRSSFSRCAGKTLNIRKENLELRNIKVLASTKSQLLKLGGKGTWPTVTPLKVVGSRSAGLERVLNFGLKKCLYFVNAILHHAGDGQKDLQNRQW